MSCRVALVEDDSELAHDLSQLIAESGEFNFVGACRDGRAALRKIPPLAPDIVIMDLRLPDISGVECTARLSRLLPACQIVIFTLCEEDDLMFRSLEAGAAGYLLKGSDSSRILGALREVRDGGVPLSSCVARKIVGSFSRWRPTGIGPEHLTPRETEVLRNLMKGQVSKEIAAELSISTETVNYHLKHIYQKLQVRSRTEAVLRYLNAWRPQ